jgi:hypothetical protein
MQILLNEQVKRHEQRREAVCEGVENRAEDKCGVAAPQRRFSIFDLQFAISNQNDRLFDCKSHIEIANS